MASRGRVGATFGALVALIALAPASARANVYEVNTAADHRPGKCNKRDCTLREAVIRANDHDGGDKVRVPSSKGPYELTRPGAGEDESMKGDLDLVDGGTDVIGTGGRAAIKQTVEDRVFHAHSGVTFEHSLTRLTLTGGSGVEAGGAVLAEHRTTFFNGVIRNNRAAVGGGAAVIGPESEFIVSGSTIAANRATEDGGGVYLNGPAATFSLSAITGNRALTGGGVYAILGDEDVTFNNVTIAKNRATPEPDATGGGIYLGVSSGAGVTRIGHATIALNETEPGAGHASNVQALDTVQMEDTIIDQGPASAANCTFDVDSVGHSLDDGTSCGLDQGSDIEDGEPGLKPLGDYGGATETMALKASSDAIETGLCPGSLIAWGTDQRGVGRGEYPVCDVGAFERP